jgi:hypothetical protein
MLLLILASGCNAPVRVEWTTESEIDTAGFNLYRGESPGGPFDVKVNQQLIPPATDSLLGGEYVYLDRTALFGKTYYYRLEEIEKSGVANIYGPVEARGSGLDWRHALILGGLGGLVAFLWVRGGRRGAAGASAGDADPR